MQKVCFVALLVTLLAAAAHCLTLEQNIPGRFVVSFHTEKRIPNKWAATARAEQQTIVNFNILLKQKNLDLIVNKLYEVSDPKSASYGKYLSLNEVQSITAPDQEVVDRVVKFTQVAGVKYTLVNGDFLTVAATVEAIESLFQTKLYVFTHVKTQKKIIRHLGALSVPAALQNDIDFVLGLSEFLDDTKFKPSSLKPNKAANDLSITPSVLRSYYKVPSTEVATSSKSLSGIIAFQDRYSAQALQQFDQLYNTKSSIVKTIGPDCLDQGCDQTESDLDVQYTTALGSGVPIWFWNHDPNVWVLGYLLDMASTANPPFINSISYGWGEVYQCDDGIGGTECSQYGYNSQQYVQRCDTEFVKAGLRGITIFVSSGDDGASGRTGACNNGQGYPQLSPEYPGSSPFVTSVGATQFLGSSSSINEVVCSINTNALITSGGGFNAYQTRPYWQDAAVKAYLQNNAGKLPNPSYFNASNRGYPDITLNGHNYQIYVTDDGSDNCPCSLEAVDGTSCSSPTSAGIFGLVNDALFKNGKSSLGFLNPLLYQMAADNPQSFFDITQGDNTCTSQTCGCSGYFAAAGWDPVSGLGSLNYSEIKKYVLTVKAN